MSIRKIKLSNKDKKGVSLLFTSEATTQLALEEFEKAIQFKKGEAKEMWTKMIRQMRMIQGQLASMSTKFADSMRDGGIEDALKMSFILLSEAEQKVRKG